MSLMLRSLLSTSDLICIFIMWYWFSMVDNLLEDIMSFGDSIMLSRFIILTALCLYFQVYLLIRLLQPIKTKVAMILLGWTNDKIRTIEQVNVGMVACKALKLDGFLVIGGTVSLFKIFEPLDILC